MGLKKASEVTEGAEAEKTYAFSELERLAEGVIVHIEHRVLRRERRDRQPRPVAHQRAGLVRIHRATELGAATSTMMWQTTTIQTTTTTTSETLHSSSTTASRPTSEHSTRG